MRLVLDAYFEAAFTCQAGAAEAAATLRVQDLSCCEDIVELGKHFLLKDRHAACLDLADALEAVKRRFAAYARYGRSAETANEGIAVAGKCHLVFGHICVLLVTGQRCAYTIFSLDAACC